MKRRQPPRSPRVFLIAAGACAWLAAASPASLVLGGGHTLVPAATVVDDLGQTHVRLQHCCGGLRVWGSETVLHPGRPGPARRAVPGPDQDGRTAGYFGDLAVMADAYGAVAAPGQTLAADLNEDGVVDDEDLAEARRVFEQFGTQPLFSPSGARWPRRGTDGPPGTRALGVPKPSGTSLIFTLPRDVQPSAPAPITLSCPAATGGRRLRATSREFFTVLPGGPAGTP